MLGCHQGSGLSLAFGVCVHGLTGGMAGRGSLHSCLGLHIQGPGDLLCVHHDPEGFTVTYYYFLSFIIYMGNANVMGAANVCFLVRPVLLPLEQMTCNLTRCSGGAYFPPTFSSGTFPVPGVQD